MDLMNCIFRPYLNKYVVIFNDNILSIQRVKMYTLNGSTGFEVTNYITKGAPFFSESSLIRALQLSALTMEKSSDE